MSDKIQKFLSKLTQKELDQVNHALERLQMNKLEGMRVRAIQGKKGVYRIRVGRIRIMYRSSGQRQEVLHITNRNEKTYRDL